MYLTKQNNLWFFVILTNFFHYSFSFVIILYHWIQTEHNIHYYILHRPTWHQLPICTLQQSGTRLSTLCLLHMKGSLPQWPGKSTLHAKIIFWLFRMRHAITAIIQFKNKVCPIAVDGDNVQMDLPFSILRSKTGQVRTSGVTRTYNARGKIIQGSFSFTNLWGHPLQSYHNHSFYS